MWYLVCTDPSFSGGECSAQSWVFVESFPPALTSSQGISILAAIVSVWTLAFILKYLRRFIWR